MYNEQRIALVIGNNNYMSPRLNPLSNPKNDAKKISQILRARKFDVDYQSNVTKEELKKSIIKFHEKLKNGGVGLFFFAGHGVEIRNTNYLIPIDAKLKKEMDTEFESINLDYIVKGMQESKNRLNIVILDACRSNPFLGGRGSKGGLTKTNAIGLFISYSTGEGEIALDNKEEQNGLFTKYLIKYMEQPLTIQEVFRKTREDVYKESEKEQFPAIYDQIINGQFYFTLPNESKILNTIEDTSKYSTLSIKTTPPNAKIIVLGVNKKYHQNIKLRNGIYKIKIQLNGYRNKELEIDLKHDINLEVKLNLEEIIYKKPSISSDSPSLANQANEIEQQVNIQYNKILNALKENIFNLDYTIGKIQISSIGNQKYDVTIPIEWNLKYNNLISIFPKKCYIKYGKDSPLLEFSGGRNNILKSVFKKLNSQYFYLAIELNLKHKTLLPITREGFKSSVLHPDTEKYIIYSKHKKNLTFNFVHIDELGKINRETIKNSIKIKLIDKYKDYDYSKGYSNGHKYDHYSSPYSDDRYNAPN